MPRWLSRPGFTVRIPWEFDSREDAFSRFGRHVHIVAVDSTTAWAEASLPRRVAPGDSTAINLFDGYRSVVLLLDADGPGRKAAAVIRELIKQQSPKTRVRDVVFSDEWLGVTELTEQVVYSSLADLAKSREDADRLRSATKYLLQHVHNHRSNLQLDDRLLSKGTANSNSVGYIASTH